MSTSSDEEDELDAAKFASVAIDSSAVIQNASAPVASLRKSGDALRKFGGETRGGGSDEEDGAVNNNSGLKLYQTRLQDLLYKHLDETFGVKEQLPTKPLPPARKDEEGERTGGIRLFRRAPPGIVVPIREEKPYGPGTKPQLRPSLTTDEDSHEHLVRLQATVVDSETVEGQGKHLREKVLASAKSSQAKAEVARKKEEERVAKLKRERGEEWLPAIAAQIAKEIASEPKLPPKAVLAPEETNPEAPAPKKKKRKKKASKARLSVVVD